MIKSQVFTRLSKLTTHKRSTAKWILRVKSHQWQNSHCLVFMAKMIEQIYLGPIYLSQQHNEHTDEFF